MTELDREELLDWLLDLQHDLAKYLALPLGFLPPDAAPNTLREALTQALLRTRTGRQGVESARAIWQRLCDEAPLPLAELHRGDELVEVVERALGWEASLTDKRASLDRQHIETDLRAVGLVLRQLIEEHHD